MTTRAKLHTAWSSVLIDSTITGALTITRNGVLVASIPAGQLVWYDHYPPLGVSLTYSVSNGGTTETAVITVPARSDHKTWLKSATDPNLSLAVTQRPFSEVTHAPQVGVYYLAPDPSTGQTPKPWITYGGLPAWQQTITVKVESIADRARLLQLISGPFLWQPCPDTGEAARWVSLSGRDVPEVRSQTATPWWDMSLPLVEHPTPALSSSVIIPGWSWTEVAATWATWTTTAAANSTWVDLVRYGVT